MVKYKEEYSEIPKIIHYIWIGKNKIPPIFEKCLESWKKYCPDYEIKKWDESNLDLTKNKYAKEAYEQGKYAFASDYARFDIIEKYGGIYLDIDVEILKNIDELLKQNAFTGIENNSEKVAPGLIMAAKPHNKFCKDILEYYNNLDDFENNCETICNIATKILKKKYNLDDNKINRIQELGEITIYPSNYFCAYDMIARKEEVTQETYSIHHYNASWLGTKDKIINMCRRILYNLLGKEKYYKLKKKVKG